MAEKTHIRGDLLDGWIGRRVLKSAAFPLAAQALGLGAMAFLIANGWGAGRGVSADGIMTLRKTSLTTLVVWGLWWPGMIAGALFLGRAWCMVCPMELVNRVGDAVAQLGRWPRARLGPVLRAGWLALAAYLLLQFLVAGLSIHRIPHATSVMLIAILATALLAGLLYRDPRSFCRSLCPAKALLSVYGRFTPVQLDVCDAERCATCASRECVSPERRHRLSGRSCPSLLTPWARRQSDNCVLCLECAKACPHSNVGLGWTARAASIRQPRLLAPFEAGFVMLAAGFVTHEVVGEVAAIDNAFHWIPEHLQAAVPPIAFGWFEAAWFLGLYPLLLWSLCALLARAFGQRGTLGSALLAAATGAAPVVAVAHLGKAVAKVCAWGGFLPGAIADPAGLDTLARIASKAVAAPVPLLDLPLVGWIMLTATTVVGISCALAIRRSETLRTPAALTGAVLAGGLYVGAFVAWGTLG